MACCKQIAVLALNRFRDVSRRAGVFVLVAGCLLQGSAKGDVDAPFGLQSRNAALAQFRLSGHSLPLLKL